MLIALPTKTCTKCTREKDLDDFAKNARRRDGRSSWCKKCDSERKTAYAEADPEKYRATRRRYMKEYRRRNPAKMAEQDRRTDLKRKFGLTVQEFDEMLAAQGGVCRLCRRERADSRGYRLHVDHCHDTGRVRGLLCGACNMGIGQLQHDPVLLLHAIEYLKEPAC